MENKTNHGYYSFLMILCCLFALGCKDQGLTLISEPEEDIVIVDEEDEQNYLLPEINLSNWKVTLPIGRPTEVKPPEILNYATSELLAPYMFNDSIDGSLVFYTTPGTSTQNSSYSRTELREQMIPGSNSTNWTFAQGGRIKGTLSVPEISLDENGDPYRTIVMQIHGRLTNEQRDLISEDDNNAPPIMKVYWTNGYVRLKSKYLKDPDATYEELLHTDAWGNDEGYTFPEYVGTEKFTLEIVANASGMQVTLNDTDTYTYSGFDMEKWAPFENYFKAGNYLVSQEEGASAKVKYYELEVSH